MGELQDLVLNTEKLNILIKEESNILDDSDAYLY